MNPILPPSWEVSDPYYVRCQAYCYVPPKTLMKISFICWRGVLAGIQTFRLSPKSRTGAWETVCCKIVVESRSRRAKKQQQQLSHTKTSKITTKITKLCLIFCSGLQSNLRPDEKTQKIWNFKVARDRTKIRTITTVPTRRCLTFTIFALWSYWHIG